MTDFQTFTPTVVTTAPVPFTNGVYAAKYGGAPPVAAGSLWAYEYTRKECWDALNTPVTNNAPINNLFYDPPALTVPNVAEVKIGVSPLTYAFQAGGDASGFQNNAQTAGNLLQLDSTGTEYLQTDLTDDFYFSTSDVYPDTSALTNGFYVFSKTTVAGNNTGGGLWICKRFGETGGSGVQLTVRCSDSTGSPDVNLVGAAPAGTGKGFHHIAIARIAGSIYVWYDGFFFGAFTPVSPTFSANSNHLVHGGRVSGAGVAVIVGQMMISDMGLNLTIAAAAIGGGKTTLALAQETVAQEWGYLQPLYGAFTSP